MRNIPTKTLNQLAIAAFVAVILALSLGYIAQEQFGLSSAAIRNDALLVASLVVAFLLVGGVVGDRMGKN
jgi:hypothetical protein